MTPHPPSLDFIGKTCLFHTAKGTSGTLGTSGTKYTKTKNLSFSKNLNPWKIHEQYANSSTYLWSAPKPLYPQNHRHALPSFAFALPSGSVFFPFFSPTPLGQSSSSAIHLHLIQNCFKLEHFYSLPIPSNSSVAKFPSTSSLYLSLTPTPHSLVRASPPHSVFCIAFLQLHFLPLTFPFNTIPSLSLFSFTYFSFSFFINNFFFNNNSFLLDFHFLLLFIYLLTRLSF